MDSSLTKVLSIVAATLVLSFFGATGIDRLLANTMVGPFASPPSYGTGVGERKIDFIPLTQGNLAQTKDGDLTISGILTANNTVVVGSSDIYFTGTTHNHTGIGNTPGYAAIENAANYDTLMILGRSNGIGGVRSVSVWDRLDINGNLCINTDCKSAWPSGMSGSGTSNYVTKWTGSNSLGNSSIYDNGDVGIGTTEPIRKLQVVGDIYVSGSVTGVEAYGTSQGGYFKDSDASGYSSVGNGDFGILAYGNSAGGFFRDLNSVANAYIGYSGYGISSSGETAGGYFTDTNNGSYAYVAYGGYSLYGNTTIYTTGNIYGSRFYDRNNTAYYMDPAGISNLNDFRASDIQANRFYDRNNTAYYVDPASTSYLNAVRANIFYDRNNTAYYVDPASTSNMNAIAANSITKRGRSVVHWCSSSDNCPGTPVACYYNTLSVAVVNISFWSGFWRTGASPCWYGVLMR